MAAEVTYETTYLSQLRRQLPAGIPFLRTASRREDYDDDDPRGTAGSEWVAPEWKDAILHARIDIGGTELLGADIPPERFQPMRSAYLSLSVDSIEEAERIYALLSDGGQIFMPIEETFFAFRFAMLRDQFGTSWMLLCERPRH